MTTRRADSGGPTAAPADARYPARQRYAGDIARDYVSGRAATPKWRREQKLVEGLIASLPAASVVLDVPLGTGRFLETYARARHRIVGIDISDDMLREAAHGVASPPTLCLVRGEAERLPLGDGAVDFAVSTRFLNWVPTRTLDVILPELLRVARHGAIVEIRVAEPLGRGRALGRLLRSPRRLSRALRRARRLAAVAWGRLRGRGSGYTVHAADAVGAAFAAAHATVEARYVVGCRLDVVHGEIHELRVYWLRPAPAGVMREASP